MHLKVTTLCGQVINGPGSLYQPDVILITPRVCEDCRQVLNHTDSLKDLDRAVVRGGRKVQLVSPIPFKEGPWDWPSRRALMLVDICDTDTGDRVRALGKTGRPGGEILAEFIAADVRLLIDEEFVEVIDELLPDAVAAASDINASQGHDRLEAGILLGEHSLLQVLRAFLGEILR